MKSFCLEWPRRRSAAALFGLFLIGATGLLPGQATPVLLWPTPAPIQFPAPLNAEQLNAVAVAGEPVAVPLAGSYNVVGLTNTGIPFVAGFDNDGNSYPAELLGSTLSWRGVTFPLGAANVPNAVSNAIVPLPAGSFGTLLMLGSLVNNEQPPTGTFAVKYADGTSSTLTQQMSDWVFPLNFAGESIVQCVPYRYVLGTSIQLDPVCVYGYALTLDPAKIVESLTLPNERNIAMLAFALIPAEVAGTIAYDPGAGTILPSGSSALGANFTPAAGTASVSASMTLDVAPPPVPIQPEFVWPTPQAIVYGTPLSSAQLDATALVKAAPTAVSLSAESRVQAIENDGVAFSLGGFDGSGDAYSSEQLGALRYAGGTFPLGESRVPDVATSSTLPLPPGNFETLYLMGAANGAQLSQTFTVNYSDGTISVAMQSMSDWRTAQDFSGETLVASTGEAVTESGATLTGTFNVYGYQFSLDTSKTAVSVTLPHNLDAMVLAVGVGSGQSTPTPGTVTYTPAGGSILQAGVQSLQAAFVPNDSADVANGLFSVQLTVLKAPVRLGVSPSATSVEQGQNVTLSAVVTSTTIGVPTGTITFLCNGATLGTASLVQGTASLTTDALPQGSDTIVVTYSGDVDFLSASNIGPTIDVLVSDFTLAAKNGTILTVPWGGEGTVLLRLTPLGLVYESDVSITAGALGTPFGAASISPEIVGQKAGANDVGVTVKLDSLSRIMPAPLQPEDGPVLAGLGALFLLPFAASRRFRRRLRSGAVLLLLVAAVCGMVLSGCGSGYYTASAPLTVTATDGTHTHTVTLTIRYVAPE